MTTQIWKKFCMWLAVCLLRQKYGGVSSQTAFSIATHELRNQVQTLTRERDHWKLRASVERLKNKVIG